MKIYNVKKLHLQEISAKYLQKTISRTTVKTQF